jgi:signal transduction histidine kinase
MSIRVRLIASYLAMLLVPIFLGIVAMIIILISYTGDLKALKSYYNSDTGSETSRFGDPYQEWSDRLNEIADEIRAASSNHPDSLLEPARHEAWDRRLNAIQTALIVKNNDAFIYVSPSIAAKVPLEQLPPYGKVDRKHGRYSKLSGDMQQYSYSKEDLLLPDQSRMSIYYITHTGPLFSLIYKFTKTLLFSLLLILVLTNGVLTWLMSRSIIRPLRRLTHAANQIQEGRLDFTIEPTGRDEIGRLCIAFEEMRAKLKQSVDTQLQYEENRKQLVSHISHDLRTPVTAIKGYVEGILDGIADSPEKTEKYLRTIYSKAVDLEKLIDELFLFSKLDLKRLPFDFEATELLPFMEDVIGEFRFQLEQKAIELKLEARIPREARVILDREKMKRVIVNILDNALKYMDEPEPEGRINVRLLEDKGSYTIRIEDNGRGIQPEALPYIFEQFYRADASRSQDTGGSGLGLAIAKQIVEEHGGRIGAESITGQGTVIWIALKQAGDWRRTGHEQNIDH